MYVHLTYHMFVRRLLGSAHAGFFAFVLGLHVWAVIYTEVFETAVFGGALAPAWAAVSRVCACNWRHDAAGAEKSA